MSSDTDELSWSCSDISWRAFMCVCYALWSWRKAGIQWATAAKIQTDVCCPPRNLALSINATPALHVSNTELHAALFPPSLSENSLKCQTTSQFTKRTRPEVSAEVPTTAVPLLSSRGSSQSPQTPMFKLYSRDKHIYSPKHKLFGLDSKFTPS